MTDLTSLIRDEFDGAWNAHDADRILSFFANDAEIETVPTLPGAPPVFRGPDQIRGFIQTLLPGFHVDSSRFEAREDRITWYSQVASDAFRQLGLDALDAFTTAVVRDGKIQTFSPVFTPAARARLQAAQNKALMRRFIDDVMNAGDLDAIDTLASPDFVEHEAFPGLEPGREGLRRFVTQFRIAFPDLHVSAEDLVAEGDRVAARVQMRGTHLGTFMEVPATSRRIDVTAVDIVRCADGRIAEHWGCTDALTMMQQLGVIPAAAAHA